MNVLEKRILHNDALLKAKTSKCNLDTWLALDGIKDTLEHVIGKQGNRITKDDVEMLKKAQLDVYHVQKYMEHLESGTDETYEQMLERQLYACEFKAVASYVDSIGSVATISEGLPNVD